METCPNCKIKMNKANIKLKLPRGSFILEGYRCPKCKEEFFTYNQAKKGEAETIKKGLWGSELWLERKITTIGNLPAVVIPKDIATYLKIIKGRRIKIGVRDKMIVIKTK